MAVVKNLNSNYTITNKVNPLANVIVETHTMFVNGNLLVGGNTTQVTKTELSILIAFSSKLSNLTSTGASGL